MTAFAASDMSPAKESSVNAVPPVHRVFSMAFKIISRFHENGVYIFFIYFPGETPKLSLKFRKKEE